MAVKSYKDYTEKEYNNQSSYLNNVANNGTSGQQAWAKNELNKLNSQYGGNKNTISSNGSGVSSNKNTGVTSSNKNNVGTTGVSNKPATSGSGQQSTNYDTSGWNNYTGATGKNFSVSPINGTIIVTTNGVQRRVLPTDPTYNTTYEAMQKDIGNAYTPTNSYDRTNSDGTTTTYTTKNYTQGNSNLQYALEQAAKTNPGLSTEDYVKSLYNRIGSARSDGSTVTLADVNNELNRLGLSDYNSDNVIYTVGGNLIPGNQFATFKDGNDGGSNSEDSRWVSYGGQDYLIGGDSANFANFVNGKAGNTSILDYLFDDMANNPYAMQDTEFLTQYNQALQELYNSAGITGTTGNNGTSNSNHTGYSNVDSIIDYVNSLNGYNQATGSTGGSDIWKQIQEMLQGGLESQQAFLDNQRTQAEKNAEDLMRQAYVNQKLQSDSVKEALSAAGLGTSGALQSAQLGVQSNYNNSLSDINSNLNTMISSLSEQELQALIDYTNNMTNYYYQIQNDEQDRAYQNAQLYLQQLEMQQAQQQQDWENAYKQQLLDIQNQQYADNQSQYQEETDYARKQDEASYYAQLYKAGAITAQQYQQYLQQLGLISGLSFNPAGSVTGTSVGTNHSSGYGQQEQTMAEQLKAQYGETVPATVFNYLSQAFANNQKPDLNVLHAYLGID